MTNRLFSFTSYLPALPVAVKRNMPVFFAGALTTGTAVAAFQFYSNWGSSKSKEPRDVAPIRPTTSATSIAHIEQLPPSEFLRQSNNFYDEFQRQALASVADLRCEQVAEAQARFDIISAQLRAIVNTQLKDILKEALFKALTAQIPKQDGKAIEKIRKAVEELDSLIGLMIEPHENDIKSFLETYSPLLAFTISKKDDAETRALVKRMVESLVTKYKDQIVEKLFIIENPLNILREIYEAENPLPRPPAYDLSPQQEWDYKAELKEYIRARERAIDTINVQKGSPLTDDEIDAEVEYLFDKLTDSEYQAPTPEQVIKWQIESFKQVAYLKSIVFGRSEGTLKLLGKIVGAIGAIRNTPGGILPITLLKYYLGVRFATIVEKGAAKRGHNGEEVDHEFNKHLVKAWHPLWEIALTVVPYLPNTKLFLQYKPIIDEVVNHCHQATGGAPVKLTDKLYETLFPSQNNQGDELEDDFKLDPALQEVTNQFMAMFEPTPESAYDSITRVTPQISEHIEQFVTSILNIISEKINEGDFNMGAR